MIKFVKDETVKSNFDVYKSHTVYVPSGEAPGSLSRPPAKRKPGVVRPITQGKLLKAGAPDVGRLLLCGSFYSKFYTEEATGYIKAETYTTASPGRVCQPTTGCVIVCWERQGTSACPSPCSCATTPAKAT